MDIRKQLLADHSKENTSLIVAYIGNQQERFDALMKVFFNDEELVVQRAAWVVGDCGRKESQLVKKHLTSLLKNLRKEGLHDAVKRNTVRILQEIELPESLWGEASDICFGYLASQTEPVAIKCFSMTVLLNIAQHVPALKNELKILIEDQIPYGSAGFKARGKRTLIALAKIEVPAQDT